MKKFKFEKLLKEIVDSLYAKLLRNQNGVPFALSLNCNIIPSDIPRQLGTVAFWDPIRDIFHFDIDHLMERLKKFDSGKIDSETMNTIIFILIHEMTHRVLEHYVRLGNRKKVVWNIATDMFINSQFIPKTWHDFNISKMNYIDVDLTDVRSIINKMKGVFDYEDEYDNLYEEEIYRKMLENGDIEEEIVEIEIDMDGQGDDKDSKSGSGKKKDSEGDGDDNENEEDKGKSNGKSGNNGERNDGNGEDENNDSNSDGNGEGDNDKDGNNQPGKGSAKGKIKVRLTKYKGNVIDAEILEDSLTPEQRKQLSNNMEKMQRNSQLAGNILKENIRKRGFGSALGERILDNITKVKIDWKKVFRDSLRTALSKTDEMGWSKIRKSSFTYGQMMPDYIEEETVENVIIAVDESGSMSDEDLEIAIGIVFDMANYYNNILVIKHDYEVVDWKLFEDIKSNVDAAKKKVTEYVKNRKSCGGTSHKDVFEFIKNKVWKKMGNISTIILFTDGWSDIEENIHLIDKWRRHTFLICVDSEMSEKLSKIIKVIEIE